MLIQVGLFVNWPSLATCFLPFVCPLSFFYFCPISQRTYSSFILHLAMDFSAYQYIALLKAVSAILYPFLSLPILQDLAQMIISEYYSKNVNNALIGVAQWLGHQPAN